MATKVYHGRFVDSRIEGFDSRFDLQLGDLKDELGRHSGFQWRLRFQSFSPIAFGCNLIVARLDYSQGCLELKKEEQSRATNWGYDMDTDDTIEARWASMLEQRVENTAFRSQYTHYQSVTFQENWHGYDTPNLEELVSKYIDSANTKEWKQSHNMENHIELLARMIIEIPLSNAPSNTVTLRDVEEQVITFPMFMDDRMKLLKNRRSPLPNYFKNLYRIQASREQPKENDEERRHLVEFKSNCKNFTAEKFLRVFLREGFCHSKLVFLSEFFIFQKYPF
ncbi:hypothetical protein M9H77_12610 [Catharanthus roseus]|uniref:Uncharacterized protein n=1 Tax=Catharanthus roseus TaxID=4058 RepID=A0ACC0BHX4_CATRO|nr:hypothetical protein M9H77_12610 [Catharanthus roseus]